MIDAEGQGWFNGAGRPGSGKPGARQRLSHCSVLRADSRLNGDFDFRRVGGIVDKPTGLALAAGGMRLDAESNIIASVGSAAAGLVH